MSRKCLLDYMIQFDFFLSFCTLKYRNLQIGENDSFKVLLGV